MKVWNCLLVGLFFMLLIFMLLIPAANHESSAVDRGAKITFVVK